MDMCDVLCSVSEYRVTVYTGDKPEAGSDADVYINLYDDQNARCGEWELDSPRDDFEQGM